MKSLNFNSNIKTYCINGDESRTISIDTSDFGIFERAEKSKKIFEDLQSEYENTDKNISFKLLSTLDKKIREQINYIFGSDVCTVAFGNTNCFSFCNGTPMFVGFLNALLSEVQKDMQAEQAKAEKNIEKYTSQLKKITK